MTSENQSSWLEQNPKKAILFINLFFVFLWLGVDFIYSNVISSFTHTAQFQKSVKPIGHDHVPNKTFTWVSPFGGVQADVKFNNYGFRNNIDYDEKAIKNKKVIFAIGDSTTAALENDYESSYAKVLNDKLGSDYVVFNAGVRAHDTHQAILKYMTQIKPLKPDAVVYMVCENDIDGNVNQNFYPSMVNMYGKGLVNVQKDTHSFIEPVKGTKALYFNFRIFLAANLQLTQSIFTKIKMVMAGGGTQTKEQQESFDEKKSQKLHELLAYFDKVTAKDGVKLYVTWFPYLLHNNEKETKIPRYYTEAKTFMEGLNNTTFIPTYEPLIEFYTTDNSQKEPFKFQKDPHATNYGNQLLGNLVAKKIQ